MAVLDPLRSVYHRSLRTLRESSVWPRPPEWKAQRAHLAQPLSDWELYRIASEEFGIVQVKAEILGLLAHIRERVLALPGVEAAGFSQTVPVQNSGWRTTVQAEADSDGVGSEHQVDVFIITPGFVDALGVRVTSGRDLQDGDALADASDVVLVNGTLAHILWADAVAIGQLIPNLGRDGKGARVVGVVSDHQVRSLHEPPQPVVYTGTGRFNSTSMSLVVRADREPSALITEVRDTIRAIDPELPIFRELTLREHLARSYAEMRTFAWLLGSFSVLALVLAASGLYGLLAHALRTRDPAAVPFATSLPLSTEQVMDPHGRFLDERDEPIRLILEDTATGVAAAEAELDRLTAALESDPSQVDAPDPHRSVGWIEHPHAFDEQTVMPEMNVSEADSRDIVAYLYTLR